MKIIKVDENNDIFITDKKLYLKVENVCEDKFVCNIFSCETKKFFELWDNIDSFKEYLTMPCCEDEIPEGFDFEKGISI